MEMTWHQLGNTLIRINGDFANIVSYCHVYVRLRAMAFAERPVPVVDQHGFDCINFRSPQRAAPDKQIIYA